MGAVQHLGDSTGRVKRVSYWRRGSESNRRIKVLQTSREQESRAILGQFKVKSSRVATLFATVPKSEISEIFYWLSRSPIVKRMRITNIQPGYFP